jgi:UDP-N-acetylglucosamine 4,6-dehydratase/5-epimerase
MLNFNNKIIFITGGTGSFGSEFLNYLVSKTKFKEIRIFSRDELKQEKLRLKYNNRKIKFIIGDIRDYESLKHSLQGVDFVFHAAALKQVPSCEFFPLEAVKTNILGSENVFNAAINNNVKKVVFLSTDKAVYPINVMGMTKAIMEKIAFSKFKSFKNIKTIISGVRYGNVMMSRGSVIPLFLQQAKNNIDLTLTDSEMTRFMLPLKDSIDLVVKAFQKGGQGEIFIKKSPSAYISDIAKTIIKINKSKSQVKIIGTRHGEKKYETLATSGELLKAKNFKNYFIVRSDLRDINYNLYFNEGSKNIYNSNDYTSNNTNIVKGSELKKLIIKSIEDYELD